MDRIAKNIDTRILRMLFKFNGGLTCYCGKRLRLRRLIARKGNRLLLKVDEMPAGGAWTDDERYAIYSLEAGEVLEPGTFGKLEDDYYRGFFKGGADQHAALHGLG